MKKLLLLFFILIFNVNLFAFEMVNLQLNYDGKVHTYNNEEIKIFIDDEEIKQYEIPPIILDGRTLVPLRSVFEKLGADVFWDANKKEVIIMKNKDKIVFKINSIIGLKNDNENFNMDVPAKIINNYTMVPIRVISQALNCFVDWNSEKREIYINQKKEDDILQNEILNNNEQIDFKQDGIKIVWDQIGNINANNLSEKRKNIDGLDVISPTWFAIENSKGDILDKGSIEYVNWAKEQGYQVWGLVTNSFSSKITHDTLSDSEIRKNIIEKLCELAEKYKLDGINIDFESVAKEDGDYYLQFIKEATPVFKDKGLIVSVDMYIPTPWTEHYQMKEVGNIVDYVIIMAYDEHYSTSKVSGSVSSIKWADKAMQDASKLVEKEKLIMGIPFYTRIWSEEKQLDGTVKVTSKSLKMEEAYKILNDNNANIVWNEDAGQHYGEFVENGIVKKIWLEDEASIEERMKVSRKYDVKGIAAWKRGHEKDEVWDIINKYYK